MELLSFDEFINEGYLLSLAKVYSKDWNKSRYKDLFLLYPHDKNAYRIFLDFKTPITKTIVPKPIENAIKSLGYVVFDYKKGFACKQEDKNQETPKSIVKIGKLFQYRENKEKCKEVLNLFLTDPSRIKEKDYLIVISRHPYDIAGMSTGRGWISCTDINRDGLFPVDDSHLIKGSISNGTLIAYLIESSDKNIKHPTCRTLLKPYINVDDRTHVILIAEKTIYGEKIPGFLDRINEWLDEVNNLKEGVYRIHSASIQEYGGEKSIPTNPIHNLTKKENLLSLTDIAKASICSDLEVDVNTLKLLSDDKSFMVRGAVASSDKTPLEILRKLSKFDNYHINVSLCNNLNIDNAIIKELMTHNLDTHELVNLAKKHDHDNETAEFFISSDIDEVRIAFASVISKIKNELSSEIYIKMSEDYLSKVRCGSLSERNVDPIAVVKIIKKLLNDKNADVRALAAKQDVRYEYTFSEKSKK